MENSMLPGGVVVVVVVVEGVVVVVTEGAHSTPMISYWLPPVAPLDPQLLGTVSS